MSDCEYPMSDDEEIKEIIKSENPKAPLAYQSFTKVELENFIDQKIDSLVDEHGLSRRDSLEILKDNDWDLKRCENYIMDKFKFQNEEVKSGLDSMVTCPQCTFTLPRDDACQLSCNHYFCRSCLGGYLIAHLEFHGKSSVLAKCPRNDCAEIIGEETFQHYLNDEQVKKYAAFKYQYIVETTKAFKICPNKSCDVVTLLLGTKSPMPKEITCRCGKKYCSECLETSHVLLPCYREELWNQLTLKYTTPNDIYGDLDVKPCPNCHSQISKEFSVALDTKNVRCPHCDMGFCWKCLRSILDCKPSACKSGKSKVPLPRDLLLKGKNRAKWVQFQKAYHEVETASAKQGCFKSLFDEIIDELKNNAKLADKISTIDHFKRTSDLLEAFQILYTASHKALYFSDAIEVQQNLLSLSQFQINEKLFDALGFVKKLREYIVEQYPAKNLLLIEPDKDNIILLIIKDLEEIRKTIAMLTSDAENLKEKMAIFIFSPEIEYELMLVEDDYIEFPESQRMKDDEKLISEVKELSKKSENDHIQLLDICQECFWPTLACKCKHEAQSNPMPNQTSVNYFHPAGTLEEELMKNVSVNDK
jgi:hypothetical protein